MNVDEFAQALATKVGLSEEGSKHFARLVEVVARVANARGEEAARELIDDILTALQPEAPEGRQPPADMLLWLHGVPCEGCEGSCRHYDTITLAEFWARQPALGRNTTYRVGTTHVAVDSPCPACHGDGTALGAFVFAQLEHLLTRSDLIVPPALDTTSP